MKKFFVWLSRWYFGPTFEEECEIWRKHRLKITREFDEALKRDPESRRRLESFFNMESYRAFGRKVWRRV